ncbi:MAG: sugar ABC transporter substrate-binding protein [Actinobacteria bacterium]|nr:sugar ABC transporter substrate-binding protein [Actinomycetota bacterium]
MKNIIKSLFITILIFTVIFSTLLIFTSCKKETAETTVAETTAAAETTVAETTTATEKVTLEFWLYGGVEDNIKWNKTMVEKWNSENPDIQVNLTLQSWETMFEHFQTAASTGTMPDIARVHGSMVNQYGTGGFLEPLNNFSDYSQVKNDYIEGYLHTLNINGQQYGFPQLGLIFILMGNKKMLNDAGYQELPKTWDELKETAKKLTVPGKQWGYSIIGANTRDFTYRWSEYMFKAGGDVLNTDWSKSLVTEPAWEGAVQLFADMKKDGSLDPAFLATDFEGQLNKIAGNQVAMWLEGGYIIGPIAGKAPNMELLYGAVPAPAEALGKSPQGTLQDIIMVCMSSASKHKEAAWKFLKWYTGPEADKDYVLHPELGGLPVCKASMDLPEWKNIPGFEAYQAEGGTLRAMPAIPTLVELIEQGWAPSILKAVNGDMSVEDALKEAQSKCDAILSKK